MLILIRRNDHVNHKIQPCKPVDGFGHEINFKVGLFMVIAFQISTEPCILVCVVIAEVKDQYFPNLIVG